MDYKGYTIVEVFRYTNGKSDFEVYPEGEPGYIFHSVKLSDVKEWIDERIELETIS
jgi:hypothetical protein